MNQTSIEWTDHSWNPIRGCSRISEGCRNCYAERVAARFSKPGLWGRGLAEMTPSGPRWTGKMVLAEDKLAEPISWKVPLRIFVNSMSDLFHEAVEEWWIDQVFGTMAACSWHTFQVLTKRPDRMRAYLASEETRERVSAVLDGIIDEHVDPTDRRTDDMRATAPDLGDESEDWPLRNVWLGTSVENQEAVDKRVPELIRTPAAVRFLSCEPLLEAIDLRKPQEGDGILGPVNWVIVGGESGPNARPCNLPWVRGIVDACKDREVPVFVKQFGANAFDRETELALKDSKGGDMSEWPEDVRIREFPRVS